MSDRKRVFEEESRGPPQKEKSFQDVVTTAKRLVYWVASVRVGGAGGEKNVTSNVTRDIHGKKGLP